MTAASKCLTVALSRTLVFIWPSLKIQVLATNITSNPAHKLAWALSQLQELLALQVSLILGQKVVLTNKQMTLEATDPDLAAVLKREAGK